MADPLSTARLTIELAAIEHASLLRDFFVRNDAHLARWDPPRPAQIRTEEFWRAECERAEHQFHEGEVARWVLFMQGDRSQAIGRVNFTQIVRGPFHSCVLGYAIDAQHQGHALMREALEVTIAHAFNVMRLHRIQASYIPANLRSGRLLRKLGFKREGLAPNYLYIDGAWRDHVVTALINSRFDSRIFRHSDAA